LKEDHLSSSWIVVGGGGDPDDGAGGDRSEIMHARLSKNVSSSKKKSK